jgi:opacity protein-like surface antigen
MHDTDSSGEHSAMPAVIRREVVIMKRFVIVACFVVLAASWGRPVSAQPSEPPRFEISILPGGVLFFTESDTETDFGSYALAGAFTANVSRFVGIEGEFGAGIGVDQDLDLAGGRRSEQPPHLLTYSGSLVVYPAGREHRVQPYVLGGLGGLTLLERRELGVDDSTSFLTGHVGGGIKAYFAKRIGIRAEYRFLAVGTADDAPAFFGRVDTRYGHRVAGGIVLDITR